MGEDLYSGDIHRKFPWLINSKFCDQTKLHCRKFESNMFKTTYDHFQISENCLQDQLTMGPHDLLKQLAGKEKRMGDINLGTGWNFSMCDMDCK